MTRKCPLCGLGLSAKYRGGLHYRHARRAIRRSFGPTHPVRRIWCAYVEPA